MGCMGSTAHYRNRSCVAGLDQIVYSHWQEAQQQLWTVVISEQAVMETIANLQTWACPPDGKALHLGEGCHHDGLLSRPIRP